MVDIQAEFIFWGRQLTEHALFLNLGLEDPALKSEAARLHDRLQPAYDARRWPDFMLAVHDLRGFKVRVRNRLAAGEWLGWLWLSFVDHILRELDYFLGIVAGTKIKADSMPEWLVFMGEHAAFAAHLLDPVAVASQQSVANALGQEQAFNQLEKSCMQACGAQLISLSIRQGQSLDAYFRGLKAPSVIHPLLADHVVREGQEFLRTASGLVRT